MKFVEIAGKRINYKMIISYYRNKTERKKVPINGMYGERKKVGNNNNSRVVDSVYYFPLCKDGRINGAYFNTPHD